MERFEENQVGRSRRRRRRRSQGKGTHRWTQVDPDPVSQHHPASCTTSPAHRALKRKRLMVDHEAPPSQHPWTSKRALWAVTQKNALVQLHELRPRLQYEVMAQTGPPHAPVFSVGVRVNGLHFQGRGPSKKQAKLRAAQGALQSFIQFPNAPQAHAAMGGSAHPPTDFTADQLEVPGGNLDQSRTGGVLDCRQIQCEVDPPNSTGPEHLEHLGHLSPASLLHRLRPGLRYRCLTEKHPGRRRSFIMAVRVGGRVFEGCGLSKRLAKARAAAAVLQSVYSISLTPERKVVELQGSRAPDQLPQFFAESILQLVMEKYFKLTHGSAPSLACPPALAAIVMTTGLDLRSAQVVTLATGSRCREAGVGDDRSEALSDCHAEVISRRALVHFLLAQLELLWKPAVGEPSIFVPTPPQGGGVFRLRGGVLFHMYVSSSPCGDARLNCPYERTRTCPVGGVRCRLRVKVGGGEGTLPLTALTANHRRDRCILGGRSMSCTDKMAKWSVVGLQGALLSHLVEPVYLHSLTVATLSHTGHLGRALARRLAPVTHLPRPYRRQRLLLGCLSGVRPAGKSPDVSVNWSRGDGGLEEVSSATGQQSATGGPSRLCRSRTFSRWRGLQRQARGVDAPPGTYSQSKMAAGRYQRATQRFVIAQERGGLGAWCRKPPELGQTPSTSR